MADLIATEAYAQSVSGRNASYTPNLGCTKSRAIALGCNVKGTYTNNQLIRQVDLSRATPITYSLLNTSSNDLTNVYISAGSCIFSGNIPAGGMLYSTGTPSGSSWYIQIVAGLDTYEVSPSPSSSVYSYTLYRVGD